MKCCKVCGYEVEQDDCFCSNCCEPLKENNQSQASYKTNDFVKNTLIITFSVIGIILIVVLLFAVSFLRGCL